MDYLSTPSHRNLSLTTNSQPDQSNTAIQPSPSTANSQPSETPTWQADDLKSTDFPNNETLRKMIIIQFIKSNEWRCPQKNRGTITYDKKTEL